MDAAHWPQEMGLFKPVEALVSSAAATATTAAGPARPQAPERRARPQKEQALSCPRCNSTNTKFCYYNNYSRTQPRYFCKACKRYWTEGGSLRNVPVGGGSRKNKRSSLSTTAAASTTTPSTSNISRNLPNDRQLMSQNMKFHEGQNLNLGLPEFSHQYPTEFKDFPYLESNKTGYNNGSNINNQYAAGGTLSAMQLLHGMTARNLGIPFIPTTTTTTTLPEFLTGYGLVQEFRQPKLSTQLMDGTRIDGCGRMQGEQETNAGAARLLFPFEDLKTTIPSSSDADHFKQNSGQSGDPSRFWNGMIGGGGSW